MFLIKLLVLVFVVGADLHVKADCPTHCQCNVTEATCVDLHLTEFPEERFPSRLWKLDFSRNNITKLDEFTIRKWMIVSLKQLNLSNNEINRIHEDSFIAQSGLEKLDLSRNKIVTFPVKTVAYVPHLQWLSLANNRQLKLPEDEPLLESKSLQVLHLEYCDLDKISVMNLHKVVSLQELYISHNKIKTISTEVQGITQFPLQEIRILDTSYNQLQQIPPEIRKLPNLEKLYARNNKLNVFREMECPGEFCERQLHNNN